MRKLVSIIILSSFVFSCNDQDDITVKLGTGNQLGNNSGGATSSVYYTPDKALKNIATFPIGVAMSQNQVSSTNFATIAAKEFNSVTAGNEMKFSTHSPTQGTYNWVPGDAIVNFAQTNGMRVHGHVLIWHQQVPTWVTNFTGTNDQFETAIQAYVTAVVTHYKGKVASWDVVNEAFNEDGSLRSTVFSQRLGPNYIAKIFQWARAADSTAKLFYNDFNLESNITKANAAIALVNANPTLIDGIGLQMHISITTPSATVLNTVMDNIVATGKLVHFSELDVIVNPTGSVSSYDYSTAITQANKYKEVVGIYKAKVPAAKRFGITIWGMRDVDSWLKTNGSGFTDYPLLFGDGYEYKIPHKGFIEGLQ